MSAKVSQQSIGSTVDEDTPPASVRRALQLLTLLLALGAVTVLLMVVRVDDLIRVWAEGNPATKDVLATSGLEAVKEGPIAVPHFVPVALTLFVVLASLVFVLGVFLRNGFEWARVAITLVVVFAGIASVGGLRTGVPRLFEVCICVLLVVGAVLMVPLWHRDTTAYIHAAD